MAHSWPSETVFRQLTLDVEDRNCPHCGQMMHVCTHRDRRLLTLEGPLQLKLRLFHCPLSGCQGHTKTFSSEAELGLSMPWWLIGWDVFAWIGHRRLSRHWSVPQIRDELCDRFAIDLSEDAIERYIHRYQIMLAARQQDFELLRDLYREADGFHLTIDGLQPEKGHETLYVVREVGQKRVWFAEPLVSSSESEVRRLLVRARQMAEQLGKPVLSWMSDKQDAFVTGIAAEFPGVPHRYCQNHFLRDLAKPVLEQDSHAKVKMRSRIRGLRAIEREVLEQQQQADPECPTADSGCCEEPPVSQAAGEVVLEYCAAVRGILNDDQGGPLHPPGLRMAEALKEVNESLQRNLAAKKGGLPRTKSNGSRVTSAGDLPKSKRPKNKSAATSATSRR
jgi:hypothetical protein